MDNYNNLQGEDFNLYPKNGTQDDYNELIDIDTRQSFSSSKERPDASKRYPGTPTENQNMSDFLKYQTENGNIASMEEHNRQEFLRSHPKNPDISIINSSPTKGSKTGLTRYRNADILYIQLFKMTGIL